MTTVIEICDLYKEYDTAAGAVPVLKGVDFSVAKGSHALLFHAAVFAWFGLWGRIGDGAVNGRGGDFLNASSLWQTVPA